MRTEKIKDNTPLCYTYPVTVNAEDYLPESGYPFISSVKKNNIFEDLLVTFLPIAFNIANNILIRWLIMQHHGHSRPTNPAQVKMEQEIRIDQNLREHYEKTVIQPRLNNIFVPVKFYSLNHTERPTANRGNAWLVSFAQIDEKNRTFDDNKAFLCFSKKEADQLKNNMRLVMHRTVNPHTFFNLPETEETYSQIYKSTNMDTIYNAKLKKLKLMKNDMDNKIEPDAGRLRNFFKRLVSRSRPNSMSTHHYFRKYAIVEASNKNRDPKLYQTAISFLTLDASLHMRREHNLKYKKEIEDLSKNIEDTKNKLKEKVNYYLKSHVKDYIKMKFALLDEIAERDNILLLPLLKIKTAILNDLAKIDYIEIYNKLPKHAALFTVDFKHFDEIIDKKIADGNINTYLLKKTLSPHP